ncbi:MAG: NUDIX hydrolase [Solirubrobacterales bacterium]|nr:NUDIX hydrolase [Solirubrobacterales bacterium]
MPPRRPVTSEQLDDGPPATPRPSAALILLRETETETEAGFELLLVRRNPEQRFMGGYWVFPGGAVDAHEGSGDAAHRAAAVRELHEEADIGGVQAGELVAVSRWITPEMLTIRFDTRFYLARCPAGAQARCDGLECVDLRWDTPRALLGAYEDGMLTLALPTLRQLEQLAAFSDIAALLDHARGLQIEPILPRVVRAGSRTRLVLPGEPGYDQPPITEK